MKLRLCIILTAAFLIPACSLFTGGIGLSDRQSSSDPSPTPTETASSTPSPTASATATPIPTATPTATPTPIPEAMVVAQSLALYDGPGYGYERLGSAHSGDRLEVIGHYDDCSWLKVITPDRSVGWAFAYVTNLEFAHPCSSIPGGTFRPFNGNIVLDNRPWNGWGTVKVINQRLFDTVVVLTYLYDEPVIAIYIRAEESFTIGGLPDDDYLIYLTEGDEWDGVDNRFTHLVEMERFVQILDFGTIVSGPQTTYTVWTITLGAQSGTAAVDDILPEDFPSLK